MVDLRTPGEIMGEFASDYWSARDWQLVHDGVKQAQQEAVEVYEPVLRELRESLRPLKVETDPAVGMDGIDQVQRFINAKDAVLRLLGEIP